MGMYVATVLDVVSGTSKKTMMQLVAAATGSQVEVIEWSVSFNGTNAAAAPVLITVNRQTTAGTQTGINENPVDGGGTAAATAFSQSAEPTDGLILYQDRFTPVGLGPAWQYPLGRGFVIPNSGRLGWTVTAAVTVNCTCTVRWVE